MSTASKLIAKAASQIGYYKKPGTKTVFGEWYGIPTGQWCAMFVSWAAAQVGLEGVIPRHAYTPSGVAWFQARGQWHKGISGIRRGDIVYFDFPGAPNRVSHVGIVESVNSDGSFNTIEGNTSGPRGDQRNGGAVMRKRRKSYAVGYGRPAYGSAPKQQKNWLEQGDTGEAVKDLQRKLISHGFGVGSAGVDGSFGPATRVAVVAFQRSRGLDPDGYAGPLTMAALDKSPTVKQPKRPDCRALQRAVRTAADNSWGPNTDKHCEAVRKASRWGGQKFPFGVRFTQQVVGTTPDGSWGPKSVAAHDRTVWAVQSALFSMGFNPGRIDGFWGDNTEAAFQKARKACRI